MSTDFHSESRAELAPSQTVAVVPALARVIGLGGLFCFTVGVMSVIAGHYGRGLFAGTGIGYLFAAVGLTGLFIHAARDGDVEVRRLYGMFAGALLCVAIVISTVPGPFTGAIDRTLGYYFLPWGAMAALVALLFAIPFSRHEHEEPYIFWVTFALLTAGLLLSFGAVVAGVIAKETLVGPGLIVAILGVGYLSAYFSTADTSDGVGYKVAGMLGTMGGSALIIALGQSIVPTVLHEGPSALKTPLQTYDTWKVVARIAAILASLGLVYFALKGRVPSWLRGGLVVLGVAFAGVFLVGSFAAPIQNAPKPYLVPYGLLLGGIGVFYLAVAVGITADAPFVVLTRRELSAFFYSPVAYIVLFVMALASAIGYMFFVDLIPKQGALEPILQNYLPGTFVGPLVVPFFVPALTMRLLSEEKRTGTLEVLLTAPVSEATIVLSKFVSCWLFYLLCWLPAGLYLVGLRVEGGQPFDYRPLLSFYLAVAVSGAAFVSIGLFFSALTQNQIVAAVLTFVVIFLMMMFRWSELLALFGPTVKTALTKLSYWNLWDQALRGELLVGDMLIQASIAVYGLFLTVRVLEARKWS